MSNQIYFKNLFALRFVGAFAVILGHIEFIKSLRGVPNINNLPFYKNTNGHQGVILFFVISGFLITYLLINEFDKTEKINFKNFYIRRILRIWPIYYLMLLISLFIIPFVNNLMNSSAIEYSTVGIIDYFLILPNLSKALGYYYDGAVHLWSIGVEEQFYIIWPLLIYFFRKYKLILLIIIFIGVSLISNTLWYVKSHTDFFTDETTFKHIDSFFKQLKFNSMALGGIIAYLVFYKQKYIGFIQNKYIGVLFVLSTLSFWILGVTFGSFTDEVYSVLFSLIICNLISSKQTFINLENKRFNFLGKISYGLYVYHWLIIIMYIKILIQINNVILFNLLLYFLVIFTTIVVSYFSYEKIEKPFLKLKDKY